MSIPDPEAQTATMPRWMVSLSMDGRMETGHFVHLDRLVESLRRMSPGSINRLWVTDLQRLQSVRAADFLAEHPPRHPAAEVVG